MPFLIKSLALVICYLIAAKLVLTFGTVHGSATVLWPSGGIALAALLLGGLRYLPAVFIAAYLAAVMVKAPFVFGLGSALGNALETYIGYSLLKHFDEFDPKLNRLHDLIGLCALGGLIAPIASAVLGPTTLMASGLITAEVLPEVMWRWWRADVLGVVFFTPLILVFMRGKPYIPDTAHFWEGLAIWIAAIAVGQLVFFGWPALDIIHGSIGIAWLFPVLVWSGLRSGRRNTALIQLLFLLMALTSGYLGVGIFADDFVHYGLSNFWVFAMLLATIGMGLAIMRTAEVHVEWKNAQSAKVVEVTHDGVIIVNADNNIISVNPAFTQITGYHAEEVIGKNPRFLASGKESREFYQAMWKSIVETGHWEGEIWNRNKNGSIYLEKLSIYTIHDDRHRVIGYVGIFTDITLEKSRQAAVMHQAQHDYLTNLPNRLLFCDRFAQKLAFAHRHNAKFAVIYIDLDDFKPVNDRLGHWVGDQLLIEVAARLNALVREIDTVCRLGGDEFAILMSEVEIIEDVTTLANKILHKINEPFVVDNHSVTVTASLGIALYPDHGLDMETIVNNADAAMYQAKQAGNGTYAIAARINHA